jgi:Uri superfamily endonuclease
MPEDAAISVGRLGRLHFRTGNYVYVGSAMAGLEARVARHLRRATRKKWHIDFLLERAATAGAVLFPSRKREECTMARTLAKFPGVIPVGRFGSTGCGCPAHLFYNPKRPFGPLLLRFDRLRTINKDRSSGGG